MSPYNKSRKTCLALQDLLDKLLKAKVTMNFYTDNPKRLAFRLRESINAARYHQDTMKYALLRGTYMFKEREGFVQAVWMGIQEVTKVEVVTTPIEPAKGWRKRKLKPTKDELKPVDPEELEEEAIAGAEIREVLETATIPNVPTLSGIIEAVKKYEPKSPEIFFPDAKLDNDQMRRLHTWATQKKFKMIDHEERGITLTKKFIEKGMEWKPE